MYIVGDRLSLLLHYMIIAVTAQACKVIDNGAHSSLMAPAWAFVGDGIAVGGCGASIVDQIPACMAMSLSCVAKGMQSKRAH